MDLRHVERKSKEHLGKNNLKKNKSRKILKYREEIVYGRACMEGGSWGTKKRG